MHAKAAPSIWHQPVPIGAALLLAAAGFLLGYLSGGASVQLNPWAAEHPAMSPLTKLLVWIAGVVVGCGSRAALRDFVLAPRRSPLPLIALAFGPVAAADLLASQFAILMSNYPTCAPGALPLLPILGFLPRAALFGTILLTLMLAWRSRNAEPTALPEDPADPLAVEGTWLSLPEMPLLRLRADDVLLIRSAGNYSEIVTSARTHLVRVPLSDLAGRYAALGFVRVHRQIVINAKQVREVAPGAGGRGAILLVNGETVPLGRSYAGALAALR